MQSVIRRKEFVFPFQYLVPGIVVPLLLFFLTLTSFTSFGTTDTRPNHETISSLDREIAANSSDPRYVAALKGLRWCVAFCQDDGNFEFTFTDYLTMLDELTLHHPRPALMRIVHQLIVNEFSRAAPRLDRLFPADADGYESFISILPVAYHHQVRLAPLKEFASRQFAQVAPVDRLGRFREAVQKMDYDAMTDSLVGATFLDMAYRWGAARDFRLPPNSYPAVLKECAAVPFESSERDGNYSDQNYYATHLLLALNHYGQRHLAPSATADRLFFYLAGQYETVRHRVGDLDLLCEYLCCFRQFAPAGVGFIEEGERFVMSRQRPDGAWGAEDQGLDPYGRLHPTRAAITLLAREQKGS